jgi:hypothetical protein
MSSRSYTALGWIVWQIGSRVARRKLSQNRSKLVAAGVVAAVVAAGIALASSDDD